MMSTNLPDNWKIVHVDDICLINKNTLSEKSADFQFKYIDLSSVKNGKILCSAPISFKKSPSRARRIIRKNDIIMSTVRPNLQGFAHIDFDAQEYICSTGFAVLTVKPNTSSKFIYYCLYSKSVETQINNMLVGSNYPAINSSDVASLKIFLPPLPEQEKIAEILGTWDDGIEKLSKLIEAKKLQKKGLMQKLLTGKHRLKGFIEPWKEVKLEEISKKICDKNNDNCLNVVTISAQNGFINQEDFFHKSVSSNTVTGYYLIKRGDFGYNRSYSKGYPMGAIKRLNNYIKGVVSTLYICFRPIDAKINSDFLEQYSECGLLNKELYKVAQEGARNHGLLNISLNDFFSIKLTIPPDIVEQKAITDILSVADEEIDILNKKLEALKEQKKGLVQQLLTGKIRVKVN